MSTLLYFPHFLGAIKVSANINKFHKVGIGMPVYNGERYLEQILKTNLSQTFDDFSLVIADNASTDRTEEICRDFASRDPRIHYIRNPVNLGASKNYEACFTPTKCEYFRWSNADDPIEPTLVEKCVKVLDENPDVVLTYGKTNIIDKNDKFLEHYDDNLDLRQEKACDRFISFFKKVGLSNIFYGLMRRDQLAKTALMGNYVASDINLIGEFTLYGKYYEIPEYLFNRRMHPGCSSWDRDDADKQREFWDPSQKSLSMQTWRSMYEYFKAIYRVPIPLSEKRIAASHLLRRCYWRKKELSSEVFQLLKPGKT